MRKSTSVSLDKDSDRMLDEMCEDDKRNRSNMMSWLIQREYQRRGKEQKGQSQPNE